MKRLVVLTLPAAWMLPASPVRARQVDPIRPVHTAEVDRYLGRWYVIASMQTRLGRDGYNAVETFRRNDDGSLCIWLRQRAGRFDAPARLFKSTASVIEGSGHGEWRLRFFAFLTARYLVGWLKPDGSQAMVVLAHWPPELEQPLHGVPVHAQQPRHRAVAERLLAAASAAVGGPLKTGTRHDQRKGNWTWPLAPSCDGILPSRGAGDARPAGLPRTPAGDRS